MHWKISIIVSRDRPLDMPVPNRLVRLSDYLLEGKFSAPASSRNTVTVYIPVANSFFSAFLPNVDYQSTRPWYDNEGAGESIKIFLRLGYPFFVPRLEEIKITTVEVHNWMTSFLEDDELAHIQVTDPEGRRFMERYPPF